MCFVAHENENHYLNLIVPRDILRVFPSHTKKTQMFYNSEACKKCGALHLHKRSRFSFRATTFRKTWPYPAECPLYLMRTKIQNIKKIQSCTKLFKNTILTMYEFWRFQRYKRLKIIVHYATSAMKRFSARVSYEILYHEVWKCGFPHAKRA